MSLDVVKKFYSEGEEYEIVDLLKLCFDEWKLYEDPVSYWKWKWVYTPNGYTIIISKQGDRIVAVTQIMYLETKLGNSIMKTSYSDDLATHPDFRGKGLYKELRDLIDSEEKKKGSKIIFSINTNPITINTNLKRGRVILPHTIEHVALINDTSLHFKKSNIKHDALYSTSFKFLQLLNNITNVFNIKKYERSDSYQIKQITSFDKKYDIFWDKIKEDYKFISIKNSSFLNWRYSDKRGGNNHIYEIVENGAVLGFAVLEVRDRGGYKSGYVLELLSLKNRDDVILNLAQHLKKEMSKLDVNIINFKTTSNKTIKLLEQKGFIKMPFTKEFKAMYKFIDSDIEKEIFLTTKPDEVYWGYGNYFQ